ncbi:inositol phosphophingolipids phospholipase C [Desarmillaria tabescens]|uniref:Inositol phosphophingolipids phospholipase C n=1 Tax=Armillaria tabescens TaxID=1929756 RepID=A0AA39TNV3_ARMTA|nr:inositol phosphophingolipids phospholipase C [Desarmillaria tabescens]KAK0465447.1 inositol phosphophingolipids phospholipase C [Desarmillaria tabescens]
MVETQLRVLTLNCWGLKYVSKNRVERIRAIASELSNADYDIITLQELWVFSDYVHVRESVSKRLPHSKFFYSGALGSGLAIFTRFPIIATSVHPYSLSGAPIDVIAGDWFVGKAATSVVILHPVLGQVQIFNTHLFAKGGEEGPEHNRAHRLAAELGRYVVAAGDFNSIPTTLPMTIIRDHASLHDSWAVTHPSLPSSSIIPPPHEAITKFGVTADSPMNSYSAGKPLDPLDYIFYRQPVRPSSILQLKCTDCKVVLTHKVPGTPHSFSDHFGLEATLEIQQEDAAPHWAHVITFSRYRARRELYVFGLCLVILVAIVIGSSWLPHPWINPIFLVFTIFIAWLATTMLYEGFLYGQWECNALMNVVEELEIYKKGLEIRLGAQS